MDRERSRLQQGQLCPILCLTKAVLFVLISAFLLYLPLGDPKQECSRRSYDQRNNLGYYCLCNFYKLVKKTTYKVTDIIDALGCSALDALYEVKLRFYSLLKKMDRDDLCRSICCSDEEENLSDKEKHPGCKCVKSCRRKFQK